jgi:hypothetical protein
LRECFDSRARWPSGGGPAVLRVHQGEQGPRRRFPRAGCAKPQRFAF